METWQRFGAAFGLMICLMLACCTSLPPNTPAAFKTYSNASHQRIETLRRTAVGLNLERSKAHDAVIELEKAVGTIDLAKPLNDPANKPAMDRIQAMVVALKALSRPDGDVTGTLNRIDNDLNNLMVTADIIFAVLNEVATQRNSAGDMLEVATQIIGESTKRNE